MLPPPPTTYSEQRAAAHPTAASAGTVSTTAGTSAEPSLPGAFDPATAVRFALENNPSLAAIRQQRGFAQGSVVIAKTCPYNPILQAYVTGDTGPAAAGITNHVFNEVIMRTDVEVRGQGTYRRAAADAVLTRTEWEIAAQELIVSVAATRAFNSVVYRQRKLEVLEDTVKYNEQVVDQVKKLVDLNRLRPADLIVARTELDTARAAMGQGKTALALARADLRRQFGTFNDSFEVKGDLDLPIPTTDFDEYSQAAPSSGPTSRFGGRWPPRHRPG